MKQTAIAGTLLLVLLLSGFSCLRSDAVAAAPDLVWTPQPWRFESGPSVRYIDFENGDDSRPGTRQEPWKHHPWDPNATSCAAACRGVHTYCFRKGVIYRGTLVARESGTPAEPVRLTVDPAWGMGEAALYGSVRIEKAWKRCTEATAPDVPAESRSDTWYVDTEGTFDAQILCEVKDGKIRRIPIARTPNWQITDPDDPRSGWWELTGRILELDVYLDDTTGFRVGDPITGTGRWDDFDENRDNIAQSRNVVTEVADDHIRIDSRAWKKGEIRPGATITNGRVRGKVRRVSSTWQNYGRLGDRRHLTTSDPHALVGATLWVEGANMPTPIPRKVLAYRPEEHSLRVWIGSSDSGPDTFCRYFLEGLPQMLDEPGEWCFVRRNKQSGRLYLRLPDDRDPNRSVIEAARLPILIDIRNQRHIEKSGLALRFSNPVDPKWPARPPLGRPRAAAIHIDGNCSDINIHHCRIEHVGYAITGLPAKASSPATNASPSTWITTTS